MSKKILLYFILIIFFFKFENVYALENKIILKLNNEIITTLDIKNEEKYLTALYPNLKNLEKDKIFEISKNSLIRERIKKNEILKYTKSIDIEENQIEKIIYSYYVKLNIKSEDDFKNYLKDIGIKIEEFKQKISIETLWNQLIYSKFNTKVKIDEKMLKLIARQNIENESNSYFLKEIFFELDDGEKLENKYTLIKKTIEQTGFENTAIQYSISPSSKNKGEIGWIKFNSLNPLIKDSIQNLSLGEISEPISIPGGFLILVIDDVKKDIKENDLENEFKNLVNLKRNEQLNQYSVIYFSKVKKDLQIEEL